MMPALRESVRAFLDEIDTPHNAPARRMLERSSLAYDLDHPLRLDNCERCGAIDWRDCCCDPCAPRTAPTPQAVNQSRALRLLRAEVSR
ncbi:MAG: hypothetical protein WDO74_22315 [Pseudomonadota bacterium]